MRNWQERTRLRYGRRSIFPLRRFPTESVEVSQASALQEKIHRARLLKQASRIYLTLVWRKPVQGTQVVYVLVESHILQSNNTANATKILTHNEAGFAQAELDAFADDLARIATTHEDTWVRFPMGMVLLGAAVGEYSGTPYLRAQDPLIELHKSAIGTKDEQGSLQSVYGSGRPDYVKDVFKASEKPAQTCVTGGLIEPLPEARKNDRCPCRRYTWCAAAWVLIDKEGEGLVTKEEVYPHCFGMAARDGKWWDVF